MAEMCSDARIGGAAARLTEGRTLHQSDEKRMINVIAGIARQVVKEVLA